MLALLWITLLFNVLTILIAFKKRMVLYALLNLIFLFLVTGQALQIQSDLERSEAVSYLLNFINGAGFHLAVWYVFAVSSVSLAFAIGGRGYRASTVQFDDRVFRPTNTFYTCLFAYLCLVAFILIFVVVGLSEFLHSSRPGFQTGSTIFIVLLFVGIVPLLMKIASRSKVQAWDIACFLVAFCVTGGFSRIHLILYLTAMLIAFFYASGWANKPISVWLAAKLMFFGLAAAIVFFGIGAIHDAENFVSGSFGDLLDYILANPEKSLLSLDYNYRVGIEGMSGIAGLFTQSLTHPESVQHDFGASWLLQGAIQWLPGIFKGTFDSISDLSTKLDWYQLSIVPTGAETFLMSFGWFAVILYPTAVYVLSWFLPARLLSRKTTAYFDAFAYTEFACCIFFVRGNLPTWIAFSVSYGAVLLLAFPVFRRYMQPAASAIGSIALPEAEGASA